MELLKNFIDCESGATVIEYALVASLISMAIFGAIVSLGTSVQNYYTSLAGTLQSVADSI